MAWSMILFNLARVASLRSRLAGAVRRLRQTPTVRESRRFGFVRGRLVICVPTAISPQAEESPVEL